MKIQVTLVVLITALLSGCATNQTTTERPITVIMYDQLFMYSISSDGQFIGINKDADDLVLTNNWGITRDDMMPMLVTNIYSSQGDDVMSRIVTNNWWTLHDDMPLKVATNSW